MNNKEIYAAIKELPADLLAAFIVTEILGHSHAIQEDTHGITLRTDLMDLFMRIRTDAISIDEAVDALVKHPEGMKEIFKQDWKPVLEGKPEPGTNEYESSTLDDAYFDRNQAAMLAAVLADEIGYRVWWRENPDDPDWPILTIELEQGQVSWHIPASERCRDNIWGKGEPWDGHDLAEKRARIKAHITAPPSVLETKTHEVS